MHVRSGDQSPQMNVAGPDRNRDLLNTRRMRIRLGYQARLKLYDILTHLAYTANGKKSCSIWQQFIGRNCAMLTAAVL